MRSRPPRPVLRRAVPALALLVALGNAPPADDVVNLSLSDVATGVGTVGPGDHTATHASDDVYQVLTELQTNGKPTSRLSMLDHVWAFDVAPGNNYVFEVEAHRTPNDEGDAFLFSFSLDDETWHPLLTVSKDADDGTVQAHVFPVDVAGPLYVRVEDADRTPGHRQQDALRVDSMAIVSDRTTPDTTPPPGGSGMDALSADALVRLEWEASASSDVAGYVIERATGDGPFSVLASQVAGLAYDDDAVSNMTLYRYRQRTVDAAGNEGPACPEVLAVPHEGDGPVFARVASIGVGTQTVTAGWKAGYASVAVRDEHGGPVAGALVTVTFGDMYHETLSATTDAHGNALVTTNQAEKGKVSISACVVGISHPSMYYLSQLDAQTCDG